MARRDLMGARPAGKRRKATTPAPKKHARWLGKVSTAVAPKRKLPAQVGSGPDPELLKLFDGADGLGECNRRLKVARPELTEPERFALLRKHFNDVNTKWLASPGRKERAKLAARNQPSAEIDYDDGDDDPPPRPKQRRGEDRGVS